MLLLIASAALCSALNIVLLKCVGEIIKTGGPFFSLLVGTLLLLNLILAPGQLYLLNLGMKNYNHLEFAPTYQSNMLLFHLLSALVILDESRFYTWMQLSGLLGAACIALVGIFVLFLKNTVIATKEDGEEDDKETGLTA